MISPGIGCIVPMRYPMFNTCDQCDGSGFITMDGEPWHEGQSISDPMICSVCSGSGTIKTYHPSAGSGLCETTTSQTSRTEGAAPCGCEAPLSALSLATLSGSVRTLWEILRDFPASTPHSHAGAWRLGQPNNRRRTLPPVPHHNSLHHHPARPHSPVGTP